MAKAWAESRTARAAGAKIGFIVRILQVVFLAVLALSALSCVVRETRPGGCPGAIWVEGHYGPRGRWHPAHWRCPGRPPVIEIE